MAAPVFHFVSGVFPYPHITAPHIENDVPRMDAAQVPGRYRKAEFFQQGHALDDIFTRNISACANNVGAWTIGARNMCIRFGKHIPAAEDLHDIVVRVRAVANGFTKEHQDRLIAVASIQMRNLFIITGRQHVMAHAADQPFWVPHDDGYAGTKERADAGISVAEIKVTWLENFLDDMIGFFHGLR
jgi:hypothetical protein